MLILKGLLRKPLVTLLCLLFLILAALLYSLQATMSVVEQVTITEREMLELAVLRADTSSYNSNKLAELYRTVEGAFSSSYQVDIRTIGAAYSEGLILADAVDPEKYLTHTTPTTLVIWIVTCTNVQSTGQADVKAYVNQYTFALDEVIYQNEVNKACPKTFQYQEAARDSQTPEVGKQYLIWGYYSDDFPRFRCPIGRASTAGATKVLEQEGLHWIIEATKGRGDFTPTISEINQPFEEFMKTEAGKYWEKAVFSKIKICESTLNIMGTDCLESIPAWNMGDCKLISGNVFTEEQYEKGERVCLISEEIASANGIEIGDSLPLKLFCILSGYAGGGSLKYMNTYDPYAGFLEEGDWKVIGIYSTNYDKTTKNYNIHPNILFAPKQSVSCYSKYNYGEGFLLPFEGCPSYFSVILPEGGWEEFELNARKLGYAGWFEYNNGLTPENEAAEEAQSDALSAWQETVTEKTKLLPIISAILMLVAMLIYVLSKKREIEQTYAIETPNSRLFAHMLIQSLIVGALALGISVFVAKFAVPPVAKEMLYRLANPAYADEWMAALPLEMSASLSPLGRQALILLGVAILSSAIGMKRKFHFEYHKKE